MEQNHLITLADTMAAHLDRSVFTLGNKSGLGPTFFKRLKDGAGCTIRNYNRALDWFADNWPADLEWPRDVPRPKSGKRRAA